jgi:nitroreductase
MNANLDAAQMDAGGSAQAQLAERYGAQATPDAGAIACNPTLETLLGHRSVRRYSSEPLPSGLLELLVAAAQSAPSSSNLQAFSIVAVEDKDRKARLSRLAAGQRHVAEAPLLLMFVADLSRLRQVGTACGETADGLDYTESFLVALTDAAFAAQNVLVALESLGMGACYIGAMRNHPEEVAQELGLPQGAFIVFGMTIGYPDPAVETGVKPRLAQSIVLHRERYAAAPPEAFEAYDATLREFRLDQAMSDIAWTAQAAGRIRDAGSLMGRHVLREVLQARGFGLK